MLYSVGTSPLVPINISDNHTTTGRNTIVLLISQWKETKKTKTTTKRKRKKQTTKNKIKTNHQSTTRTRTRRRKNCERVKVRVRVDHVITDSKHNTEAKRNETRRRCCFIDKSIHQINPTKSHPSPPLLSLSLSDSPCSAKSFRNKKNLPIVVVYIERNDTQKFTTKSPYTRMEWTEKKKYR